MFAPASNLCITRQGKRLPYQTTTGAVSRGRVIRSRQIPFGGCDNGTPPIISHCIPQLPSGIPGEDGSIEVAKNINFSVLRAINKHIPTLNTGGLRARGSGAAGAVAEFDLSLFLSFFPFVFLSFYLSFVNGDEG